jgi:thiol peroxidase
MAQVTFQGSPVQTAGSLPAPGTPTKEFQLVKEDLSEASLADFKGQNLLLNIFPSVDTPVCATSVITFNVKATSLENTAVLCVSADLPFAQARFCAAKGIDNISTVSSFRSTFGKDYGVVITDGPLKGLLTRAVVVIDGKGNVVYTQLVPEITDEPDYDAALAALESLS